MAQLLVRNIENEVKARLQRRAKRHGRSMEEEVRDILRAAVHKGRARNPRADWELRFRSIVSQDTGLIPRFQNCTSRLSLLLLRNDHPR
jgi:plasmid stability protein